MTNTFGWRRIGAIAALIVIGLATLALGFGLATSSAAATPTPGFSASTSSSASAPAQAFMITPGAFCDEHWQTRTHNGKTYICATSVKEPEAFRWRRVGDPGVNVPPVKPSASASSSKAVVSADAGGGGELALTGAPARLIAVCGGVLLASGVAIALITRTRGRTPTEFRS